jgi:hypothetical protein
LLQPCKVEEAFSDERNRTFDLADDTRAQVGVTLKTSSPPNFLEKKSKTLSTCGIYHTPGLTPITPLAYSLRRAKMDLPPLLTKDEFLATGLVPVEPEQCVICFDLPKKTPVQVDCDGRHEFCRGCILEWFNDHNTCPTCRQPLFTMDDPVVLVDLEAEAAEAREARRIFLIRYNLVTDAFTACGLEPVLLTNPPENFRKFNHSIRWNRTRLHQSTLFARDWLANNRDVLEDGGQTIRQFDLGSSVLTIANLLIEIAILEQRPWNQANRNTWREIVVDIYQFVVQYKNTHVHLSSLYRSLVASLLDKHCFRVAHHPSPFFQEGPLLEDLKTMIIFVVFKSGDFIPWDGPIDRAPRRRDEQVPQAVPSIASEQANWHAAQWTEDVFEEILV